MTKKPKLTLQEQLAKRKFRQTNPVLYFIYKTIMVDIIGKKYNMKINRIDDINDCEGPCIVVFNHLSRLDHIYVLASTYPRRFNMLAGYNEFFRKHLQFAFRFNNVIPKKNYSTDRLSIKGMSQIIKQGGCVALAPEGLASNFGCNKPVVPGTGSLFKHFGVPVYFCHIEGAFLQNTKVCLDERYGETYATMSLLFSAEQLATLTVEEIDQTLNEKFRSDEYAWQKEKHIKWKTNGRICENLGDFCYKCPKCGTEFRMEGKGDHIVCKHCGNGATMDDYYEFHPYENSVIPASPLAWVENERKDVIDEIRNDDGYAFSSHVTIGNLPKYKGIPKHGTSEVVGDGTFTVDHKGVHFVGTRNGEPYEFHLDYKTVYTTFTVLDSSYFSMYVGGEYFDIFPDERAHTGKIILLIEEMHRYHVNYYKNFPWNDYLYEGKELGIDNKQKENKQNQENKESEGK